MSEAEDVYAFWFVEHGQEDWFGADPEFDRRLAERFAGIHARIAMGEGAAWRDTPEGRLAEIVVLDQFSRQLYRGSPRAFAQDGMALVLAQEAVRQGADQKVPDEHRMFFYMPYMHSESLAVHEDALRLFETVGGGALEAEHGHVALLRRFGRYPMRNAALGRISTDDELAYLAERAGNMF